MACYRQIEVRKLGNAAALDRREVTRNTLQKSICVLSRHPLYATDVRERLHALTQAFFEQQEAFGQTQILVDAFENMRASDLFAINCAIERPCMSFIKISSSHYCACIYNLKKMRFNSSVKMTCIPYSWCTFKA